MKNLKPILTSVACLSVLLITHSASAVNFEALRAFMESNVNDGRVVGCAAQVTKDGETVFLEAFGNLDPAATRELRTDDIVRIYSMTKAITSAAAMKLMEDGKLGIDDPVAMYIPEFADITVAHWPDGVKHTAGTMQRVAPRRPITVRDLILHTSGLAYIFSAEKALKPKYSKPWEGQTTLEGAIANLANVPLAIQPGTRFIYGLNSDVLGRVVEVASGQPFDEYLSVKFFKPLKMDDTGFTPGPTERTMPLAKANAKGDGFILDKNRIEGHSNGDDNHIPLGGEGLYSTLNDYTRFCRMIAQEGELDGERILDERTVAFMAQNHLGPDLNPGAERFGLGFKVHDPIQTSQGMRGKDRLSWGGAASTYFFIDPAENVTAVFVTQLFPFNGPMGEEFHTAVLESLAAVNDPSKN